MKIYLKTSSEDFLLWADGEICMREDYCEVTSSKSDDYEVIAFDTNRWHELARDHGYE